MDGKKNFEAYAKSLFGEDYGEKKAEKVSAPSWSQSAEAHPKPFDVIVVDSSNNILTGVEESKKKKNTTGIGKNSKKAKNPSKNDGRLTPIIIDMNESPFEEDQRNSYVRKRKQNDRKQSKESTNHQSFYNIDLENEQPATSMKEDKTSKMIKDKLKLERRGSERDDSGISLNGEENEPFALNFSRDDSESDSDLAYFCVDHMKMCKSRSDFHNHRKCNLDCTKSGTSSPVAFKSLKKVKSKSSLSGRAIESETKRDQKSSSLSGGSRGTSRGNDTFIVDTIISYLFIPVFKKHIRKHSVLSKNKEEKKKGK